MGLFTTSTDFNKEIDALLLPDEVVEQRVNLVTDFLAITNKRVIFVDAEVGTPKQEVVSIPFSRIAEVSLVRNGYISYANQIALQVGSHRRKLTLNDKDKVVEVYKSLVQKVIG